MTLAAELAALDTASSAIAQIASALTKEHDKVAAEVADLLQERWQGDAAGQFGQAWEQWCDGMRELLSGLGLESSAIALTKAELAGTDAERQEATTRLRERLGEQ